MDGISEVYEQGAAVASFAAVFLDVDRAKTVYAAALPTACQNDVVACSTTERAA